MDSSESMLYGAGNASSFSEGHAVFEEHDDRYNQLKTEMVWLDKEIEKLQLSLSEPPILKLEPQPCHSTPYQTHTHGLGIKPMRPDVGTGKEKAVAFKNKPARLTDQKQSTASQNTEQTGLESSATKDSSKFNHATRKSGTLIKPGTYDGSSSWIDYKAHFEVCTKLNDRTDDEKGMYLAVSLRGQAQGVFGNLGSQYNYPELVNALEDRFAPPNQTELYRVQLRERRQRATETLTELAQDIRRLTNLSYPTAPADVRETVAKEQFVDSLISSDMRLRIKQARPENLNEAVRHAVELEAFNKAQMKHQESQGYMRTVETKLKQTKLEKDIEDLKTSLKELQDMMKNFKPRTFQRENRHQGTRGPWNKRIGDSESKGQESQEKRCFECGSKDHFKRSCPKRQQKQENKPEEANKVGKTLEGHESQSIRSTAREGSGLYIGVNLHGHLVRCLVDTGATLSVISKSVWDKICQFYCIEKYGANIITASGDPLSTIGKVIRVKMQIDQNIYPLDLIVSDIGEDMIMGLDFMKNYGVYVDTCQNTMKINETKYGLTCKGKIGCYRIVASEKVEIQPRTEVIIRGFV